MLDVLLYATKVASRLAFPLMLGLAALGLALAAGALGRRRAAGALAGVAFAVLWIASTPALAFRVLHALETRHPPVAPEAAPSADAIVVLGGGLRARDGTRPWVDLNGSADRLLHAARLHRAGRAPWIVASGGDMPWLPEQGSEAADTAALLVEWGVPREAILLEEGSRTTWENARETRRVLAERNLRRVLLVTSALHMRRSVLAFEAFGVEVIPAPTDYEADLPPDGVLLAWLPDVAALRDTTRVVKEELGLLVYRLYAWRAAASRSAPV